MSVTKEQINALARLSKLSFSDSEIESFLSEFEEIVAFADEINRSVEGDTDSIKEVEVGTATLSALRGDEVKESLPNEKITANGVCENGYFSVRRVVK